MRQSAKLLFYLLLGFFVLIPLSSNAAEVNLDVCGEIGVEGTTSSSDSDFFNDTGEDLAEPNESIINLSPLPKTGVDRQYWSFLG